MLAAVSGVIKVDIAQHAQQVARALYLKCV